MLENGTRTTTMPPLTGEFETHLTIARMSDDNVTVLRAWADRHALKFTHILLAEGSTPSQPMLTFRGTGTLASQLDQATTLRNQLAADAFAVNRIKVEAAPENVGVPQSDSEAALHPPDRHFE